MDPETATPAIRTAVTPRLEVSLEDAGPFLRAAGLVFDEISATRVTGHLELGPEHHTPWGVVHGGVYTAAVETRGQRRRQHRGPRSGSGRRRPDQHHPFPALGHRRAGERRSHRPQPGPHPAAVARRFHRRIRQAHRPRRTAPAERRRQVIASEPDMAGLLGAGRSRGRCRSDERACHRACQSQVFRRDVVGYGLFRSSRSTAAASRRTGGFQGCSSGNGSGRSTAMTHLAASLGSAAAGGRPATV